MIYETKGTKRRFITDAFPSYNHEGSFAGYRAIEFWLDSHIEEVRDVNTNKVIGYNADPRHPAVIALLDSSIEKQEAFNALILQDHNTAFETFCTENGIIIEE